MKDAERLKLIEPLVAPAREAVNAFDDFHQKYNATLLVEGREMASSSEVVTQANIAMIVAMFALRDAIKKIDDLGAFMDEDDKKVVSGMKEYIDA
jgi:hypothetical protein